MGYKILEGDVMERIKEISDASVDSVVCDPPYGLEFMGKEWDAPWKTDRRQNFDGTLQDQRENPYGRSKVRNGAGASYGADVRIMQAFQEWCCEWSIECLRVLKPGGYLLSFGGSRTYHRMACAIEDAGFEIRDQIMWIYGSGFPKSMDVSKAMDKEERGVPQGGSDPTSKNHGNFKSGCSEGNPSGRGFGAGPGKFMRDGRSKYDGANHQPALSTTNGFGYEIKGDVSESILLSESAQKWQGWGTALKPAHEPICVARKPIQGTVVANVLKYGTGGLNIDGCRIETEESGSREHFGKVYDGVAEGYKRPQGRWPANVIHDGSNEVVELFPSESSVTGDRTEQSRIASVEGTNWLSDNHKSQEYIDNGSPSRFFYTAKTSKEERNIGCYSLSEIAVDDGRHIPIDNPFLRGKTMRRNIHPTVKPVDLMQYLCRLVTPPRGVVLDPFMGSGSTGIAALRERFDFIGIEKNAEYVEIARRRIEGDAPLINSGISDDWINQT